MSFQVDRKWLDDYCKRTGKPMPEAAGGTKRKYGNEPIETEEGRFDSRHEARVYDDLRLQAMSGEFSGLARQVPFWLPGGVKYIADFVALNNDGTFTVYDAKSDATRNNAVYRLKKRLMKECRGIEILEV